MKRNLLIVSLCLILTSCNISNSTNSNLNSSNSNVNTSSDPFDQLGGGGIADDVGENQVKGDDVLINEEIENPDNGKFDINIDNAINIDLSNIGSSENYSFKDNVLKIKENGIYVLSGTLNGAVEVSRDPDKVNLVLNNVTINTTDDQACAPIVFKSNDFERTLTIYDGSTNYLSDSIGDTSSDGDNAVIQAKKSSLIINGSGILNISSKGEETTGIKVKKNLEIYNSTININVSDHGIKSGEIMSIYEANIDVIALGDGIKTDVEATSTLEGDEFTKNPYAGYLYVYNSNIKIKSQDDGLSANSYMKINNTSNHLIDIVTNNGAPANITESSSDNADGKAIRVSGITLVDENDNETDLLSQCEDNYYLVILDGKFEINSNDDAIASKGNLLIDNGIFNISTGDDAIHAEYETKINNGTININKCYEGIEGATVEIYGGDISLKSIDDGINAANSDLINYSYNIYIGGGNIEIDASGDGVDSNGTIEFAGGTTVIYGPTKNDNGSLDADKGIKVTGGILVALGSAGMVETPATNSTQYCISYNISSSVTGEFAVYDSNNNELIKVNNSKSYQSVVISHPEFKKGSTYTIKAGSTSQSVTLSSIITKVGNSFGGGHGGGGRP